MKSLLGKLIGKNSNSPAKLDLAWLNELTKVEGISAIEASTQKLKDYLADDSLSAADRLRAQLATDKENRPRVIRITRQFVELQNMRPEIENRTATTMYFYHRQVFVGYRSFIKRFLEISDDVIFTYNRLPLVLGRALQAAYAMTRWRHYSQQSVADMTWSEIFEIFSILEQESLLDLTVNLYQGEPDSHLAACFVQACMLDNLGSSSLSKQQIEKVAMLLEKFIPWSKISRHYDEHKHLYYVDLSKDSGAKRARRFEPAASCRYWDTDQLSAKIESAIEAMDRDLPHDLNTIGDSADVLELLVLMRSEWSRTGYIRQRRSEERKRVIKQVTVSYSFPEIAHRLKSLTQNPLGDTVGDEQNLNNRLQEHHKVMTTAADLHEEMAKERWMISDESSSGYGVIFSEDLSSAVKLGKLVGLVVDGQPQHLIIGSIRSINKPVNGENHIGIKIISKQASWLQLSHADTKPGKLKTDNINTDQLPGFSGMYLPAEQGLSNWPSLLLPRIEYIENGVYILSQHNNTSLTQLESLIESNDDWVQVRINYPGS
ncbi:MAG: hypothetical protein CVU35_03395 [Betaproteobacteria bacterium HGW-Betaproteobacteria-8]|nr:MAG: hypothetical protein CVU35_03395 [Betaproteobacteria bacterium HGW-Betaproteobacteria-8]